ncbi:uncharacterized protein C6orf118-like isoform X1 [Girardinichthys multiradiatus]|uniref:uncharacterized protein C6orf118-like isoform X1 n=1 Tax=Girardinichthys multiradiatus TaxID=208333 RepID=UPI001FAE0F03|nr:uncharacterized protein C6orf118-like isoform X1 [Girardinichthys multiradiatus]
MSSSCKQKHQHFRSDVHRMLLAADAAQKADIFTYSSGHLGPRSLDQSPPAEEAKPCFWKTSQRKEEGIKRRQAQMLGCVRKKENTSGAAFVDAEVLRSKRDQARDYSSHAGTRKDTSPTETAYSSSNSLSLPLKDVSQKESNCSSVQANLQFSLNDSNHETLDNEGQVEVKLRFEKADTAKQDVREGPKVAEVCKRKLQKELKKLSGLSWPSRDRLAVFSDVFDDVCEGSPVFGRILREIKAEYDLYINHLMDSHSSRDNVTLQALIQDIGEIKISDKDKVDYAEKEVCRLEEEVRGTLEENKRVQDELNNLLAVIQQSSIKNTSLSRNEDSGAAIDHTSIVQFRRLQVLNVLEEIQQLEGELQTKLASTVAAAASERRVKDLKTETINLIASNDRLRTINKDLQKNISLVLDRERPRRAITQMLWSEIHKDLQTDGEFLKS